MRYNHAVQNKLAEKAGYKNAPEFFSQQIKELSRATLAMYGAVAEHFSADLLVPPMLPARGIGQLQARG